MQAKPSKIVPFADYDIHFYDFGPPLAAGVPSMYIQSQLHGNEVFATLTVTEVLSRLLPLPDKAFLGSLRIAPSVNPVSFHNFLTAYEGMYDLPSGKNWNRQYDINRLIDIPSFTPAQLSERLAVMAAETRDITLRLPLTLLSHSVGYKYVVDAHTPEYGMGHLYCSKLTADVPTFRMKTVIASGNPSGASFDDSNTVISEALGKPCISVTLELPNFAPACRADVIKYADIFCGELVARGIVDGNYLDGTPPDKELPPTGEVYDYIPSTSGIITHHFMPETFVEKGAPLVSVTPMRFGATEAETIFAPVRCYPLSLRRKGVVQSGTWVVRCWQQD